MGRKIIYVAGLFFLRSDFVTFIGIWLALKVVGDYKNWHGEHANRAKFMIFVIGTSLSIISVIVLSIFTQWIIAEINSPNVFSR